MLSTKPKTDVVPSSLSKDVVMPVQQFRDVTGETVGDARFCLRLTIKSLWDYPEMLQRGIEPKDSEIDRAIVAVNSIIESTARILKHVRLSFDRPLPKVALNSRDFRRSDQFMFDKDRVLYVLNHTLVRDVVRVLRCQAARVTIQPNSHGKPHDFDGFPKLCFNLTHTEALVACVVSSDQEVGVDADISRCNHN